MFCICIADDHPLYRDAIKDVLLGCLDKPILLEAASLQQVQQIAAMTPQLDVILLDLNMPGMHGLQGLSLIKQQFPQLAVAMLSAEDDQKTVLQAMSLGAAGFISKSAERKHIINAVMQILNGDIYLPAQTFQRPAGADAAIDIAKLLTRHQLKVLQLLVEGYNNKQIADALCVAQTTIKGHVSAILTRLGVTNRVQAIIAAKDIDFNRYL